MDQIEIAIRGYVDNLRQQREFAYNIMLSSGMMGKTPQSKFEVLPLPYDDELNKGSLKDPDNIQAFYDAGKHKL
jgi:hypothetical protein